jgi:hypothetical protein
MRNLFLLLAAPLAVAAQPALAQEIGRIKNVTPGGIEVVRDGDKLNANSGFPLIEGDIVVTGARQRAGITLADHTRLSVAPRSRMIISKYRFNRAQGSGESIIGVDRGAVGVDSGRLSKTGNMRFRAGSSTLGVRGTHFVIEVDE